MKYNLIEILKEKNYDQVIGVLKEVLGNYEVIDVMDDLILLKDVNNREYGLFIRDNKRLDLISKDEKLNIDVDLKNVKISYYRKVEGNTHNVLNAGEFILEDGKVLKGNIGVIFYDILNTADIYLDNNYYEEIKDLKEDINPLFYQFVEIDDKTYINNIYGAVIENHYTLGDDILDLLKNEFKDYQEKIEDGDSLNNILSLLDKLSNVNKKEDNMIKIYKKKTSILKCTP